MSLSLIRQLGCLFSCVRLSPSVMRHLLFIAFVTISSLHGETSGFSIAQNRSGTFRGVIVDTKGKRIRGASVTVEGTDLTEEVKLNRTGYFEIDLPVGMYEISVK